jgi:hypothetical protein
MNATATVDTVIEIENKFIVTDDHAKGKDPDPEVESDQKQSIYLA